MAGGSAAPPKGKQVEVESIVGDEDLSTEVSATTNKKRWPLVNWLALAIAILLVKTVAAIVWEYRHYFPPDFEANFLIGRESMFQGLYRQAFYVHLTSSPLALLLAIVLVGSGRSGIGMRLHRLLGRLLAIIVLLAVVPSGIIMARGTLAGGWTAIAFMINAVLVGMFCSMAGFHAYRRNFAAHQRWATRTFLMLCSPILLRLIAGFSIVTDTSSPAVYRWSAWISWLLPLLTFELYNQLQARRADHPMRDP